MPGLRGKAIDTTSWAAQDWRRARMWNIVFVVGWAAFFTYAVCHLLYGASWLMFVPTLAIAVIGGILQLVWLVRVSIWLKGK